MAKRAQSSKSGVFIGADIWKGNFLDQPYFEGLGQLRRHQQTKSLAAD